MSTSNEAKSKSNGTDVDTLPADIWMLRPCETYNSEYQECTSRRGRFHQRYTEGEELDCNHWKENYENCLKYHSININEFADKVISDERRRREERISTVKNNDVWEYRSTPPPEWNAPLPDNINKKRFPRIDDSSLINANCVIL